MTYPRSWRGNVAAALILAYLLLAACSDDDDNVAETPTFAATATVTAPPKQR